MGKHGQLLKERVAKEGKEANERVALAIFGQCPQLKELYFGALASSSTVATIDRSNCDLPIVIESIRWSQPEDPGHRNNPSLF